MNLNLIIVIERIILENPTHIQDIFIIIGDNSIVMYEIMYSINVTTIINLFHNIKNNLYLIDTTFLLLVLNPTFCLIFDGIICF